MKLKIFLALALIISIFSASTILLIGLLKSSVFPYIYFIFILIFLVISLVSIKSIFPEKTNISLALILIIFIALSISFFGTNLKIYSDKYQESVNKNSTLASEINTLVQSNAYYQTYITFLNNEISKTKNDAKTIQAEINQINSLPSSDTSSSTNSRNEREEEEEDD